jgi:hypothetical protein
MVESPVISIGVVMANGKQEKPTNRAMLGDDGELVEPTTLEGVFGATTDKLEAAKIRLAESAGYRDQMIGLVDMISRREKDAPFKVWKRIDSDDSKEFGLVCKLPRIYYKGPVEYDKELHQYDLYFLSLCPDGFYGLGFNGVWMSKTEERQMKDPENMRLTFPLNQAYHEASNFYENLVNQEDGFIRYKHETGENGVSWLKLSSKDRNYKAFAEMITTYPIPIEDAAKWYEEINEAVIKRFEEKAQRQEQLAGLAGSLMAEEKKKKPDVSLEELTGEEHDSVWYKRWLRIKDWLSGFKR